MPKILFVAQAVAPIGGSHSSRVTCLISELIKMGWEISVVTTSIFPGTPNTDYSLLDKVPKDVKFFRSFAGPLHAFAYRKSNEAAISKKNKNSKLKMLLVPDTFIEWLPYALYDILIKKHEQIKADIIVSSAVPYTSHLIAFVYHLIFKIPWIADYGDPWVYDPGNPRRGIRLLIEKYMEKNVLKKCSAITVTTEETKSLYISKYFIKNDKIHVLPMAYDPNDFNLSRNVRKETIEPNTIRFVYSGKIEPESRDASNFFKALQNLNNNGQLNNMTFNFVGVFRPDLEEVVDAFGLKKKVKLQAWVDNYECMHMLASANYLILFGNNNSVQVPGKIYNYIGSGRPIIYFANLPKREEDPSVRILDQSGITYWYVENSQEAIENIFKTLRDIFITNEYERSIKRNINNRNTWEERAGELSKILYSLIYKTSKRCM